MSLELQGNLPGLDCGLCGYPNCSDFAAFLVSSPDQIKRCIHLSQDCRSVAAEQQHAVRAQKPDCAAAAQCGSACNAGTYVTSTPWKDRLGREFDFYLEHFPEDPGPREVILPHNPLVTRELDIKPGDLMIGRPLGMSCGCPVTHCGVAMEVDPFTGVMTWCVTGPLGPRQHGFKNIGYYSAEAYEGIVRESRVELRIGMRHFFQPRMCMLQWRHSGLINFLNHNEDGWQVRLEGLFIG